MRDLIQAIDEKSSFNPKRPWLSRLFSEPPKSLSTLLLRLFEIEGTSAGFVEGRLLFGGWSTLERTFAGNRSGVTDPAFWAEWRMKLFRLTFIQCLRSFSAHDQDL